MPNRKLLQIGQKPELPTVAQYFLDLSTRQGEDIRLLKQRAQTRTVSSARSKSVREESWRLHPIVSTAKSPAARKRSAPGKHSASTKRAKPKRRSR